MPGRAGALCAIAMLAVLVPGCGDDRSGDRAQAEADSAERTLSKTEFLLATVRVADRYEPAVGEHYYEVVLPAPQEKCEQSMRELQEAAERMVAAAAELDAPEEIETLQEEFVSSATETIDEVERVGDLVAAGELRCGDEVHRRIAGLPSSQRVDGVLARLGELGYFPGGQ
jgi:hypothetical protein